MKNWLLLARKVERALSAEEQQPLPLEERDQLVEEIAAKARAAKEKAAAYAGEAVAVLTDEAAVECAREAGTVHRPGAKRLLPGRPGRLQAGGRGLVADRDVFPKAHEVFDVNRPDSATAEEILGALLYRTGKVKGPTTVVKDRGMSSGENPFAVKAG